MVRVGFHWLVVQEGFWDHWNQEGVEYRTLELLHKRAAGCWNDFATQLCCMCATKCKHMQIQMHNSEGYHDCCWLRSHCPPWTQVLLFGMHCYCSKCYEFKIQSCRTVQRHLSEDQAILNTPGHSADFILHLQMCISRNIDALHGIGPGGLEGATEEPETQGKSSIAMMV